MLIVHGCAAGPRRATSATGDASGVATDSRHIPLEAFCITASLTERNAKKTGENSSNSLINPSDPVGVITTLLLLLLPLPLALLTLLLLLLPLLLLLLVLLVLLLFCCCCCCCATAIAPIAGLPLLLSLLLLSFLLLLQEQRLHV